MADKDEKPLKLSPEDAKRYQKAKRDMAYAKAFLAEPFWHRVMKPEFEDHLKKLEEDVLTNESLSLKTVKILQGRIKEVRGFLDYPDAVIKRSEDEIEFLETGSQTPTVAPW